jgi:hypothetical protein
MNIFQGEKSSLHIDIDIAHERFKYILIQEVLARENSEQCEALIFFKGLSLADEILGKQLIQPFPEFNASLFSRIESHHDSD